MATLQNLRHELFAQGVVEGAHAADVLNDEVQRDELQAVLSAR